jgi:hypothetical protein
MLREHNGFRNISLNSWQADLPIRLVPHGQQRVEGRIACKGIY